MSADTFRAALAAAGFDADVEARDRLAVIRPSGSAAARTVSAERARIVTLAAAHGFTHVAVEVAPAAARRRGAQRDAAVSGD